MAAQADSRLITPSLPMALAEGTRALVEAEIERLLAVLDTWDGEAYYEAVNEDCADVVDERHDGDGDGADVAWTERHHGTMQACRGDEDGEPSLGSAEGWQGVNQTWWASGVRDDREHSDDSNEGDNRDDLEPRLPAFELVQGDA
jgi:hypothetical protein